jgi:outer membrane protein OmpA-like peptidoglycan-associated protein
MKLSYLSLLIFVLLTNTVAAQEKTINNTDLQRFKESGEKEFRALRYASAIYLYRQADTSNAEVIDNLANAYLNVKDYKNAEKWLAKAVVLPSQKDELFLKYAGVLANNQKYKEAENWYLKYAQLYPTDKRATNLSEIDKVIPSLYADSLLWKIGYLSNNTEQDEFSPAYFKDGLIFSSNRNKKWGITDIFGWNQTLFTDLYIFSDTEKLNYLPVKSYFSNLSDAGYSIVDKNERLPNSINDTKVLGDVYLPKSLSDITGVIDSSGTKLLRTNLNTRFHDGPISFNGKQNYFIYNRNHSVRSKEVEKQKGIYKLDLYEANYLGGLWYNKRPFKFNQQSSSTAHPTLSANGKLLYFVSDMEGGYGGKDIYYCTRQNDTEVWSSPINLGSVVNTEGDETFPYLSEDGKLYFSSNGHAGLGGLDIFVINLKNNSPVGTVKNVGYPLNSSKDDFGIIMKPDNATGYFSTNRFGNDDILHFSHNYVVINLNGQVFTNYLSGKRVLENALITIKNDDFLDTTRTDAMGKFSKNLKNNRDYQIIASKTDYISADSVVSSRNNKVTKTFNISFVLNESKILENKENLNDCELKILLASKIIYYDLDKSFIRPDAEKTLNEIAALLKKYPSLSISASSFCDSRASDKYNVALSLRRSNSAKRYLAANGIEESRIKSGWYGETQLTNNCSDDLNCSEADQQLNRRTEFELLKNGVKVKCDN